ncbi:cyclic pyranopterin monophosphate synthase MoaC [Candidatus Poribacteria bacterium]|nr:cyclic pyranopterin monophosphate synthase MoaC [Candidatus Poribacteria bacterium]MDE0425593.1 cyclic pyranopterin monophosphate synthase MoaC [Candidatus Poribacteria bacterium]MXY29548.1 cyclic pyranopterin monophosphate synthase MoaC [Candidatus Poribacteria bacterium]MYK16610.1 cyclic pyranopterin monophosphate synthase MoaC [Candidatus Poribacteria bacterium]
MKEQLTHFDEKGNTRMVDVGGKQETLRVAIARGHITARTETLRLITEEKMKKGDVLEVARLAGIMAAKRTGELIPLCHPLALTSIRVELVIAAETPRIEIQAEVQTVGRTGVEMEALTAVSVAALTVYDMCKAVDREMVIADVRLVKKTGGKSGDFIATSDT